MLEERGLAPQHRFGQNFLIDHNQLKRLVDASGIGAGATVLEIGPGTGTLTEELLARGARVVAAEIDRGMAALLRERLGTNPDFTLVEGDCLESKRALAPALLDAVGGGEFSLVANLPYAAATPVMMILLADHPRCRGQYVTVQYEVAQRVLAGPGSKDYGPLSVLAQATAQPGLIARLPPSCFWPQPDVQSAMIALPRRTSPLCDDPRGLVDFCQRVFEQRRKQLGSILGRTGEWPEGVAPDQRAEALSVERLISLWRTRGGAR